MSEQLSQPQLQQFPGTATVVVRGSDQPTSQLRDFMDLAIGALQQAVAEGAFVPSGAPFSRYDTDFADTVTLEVGFPVAEALAEPITEGRVTITPSTLPPGRIACAEYRGGYEGLSDAWQELMTAVASEGFGARMPCWEVYETAPSPDTDPEDMRTTLVVRVTEIHGA